MILELQSHPDDISSALGDALKKFLDWVDFSGKAPHKNLITDLKSLSSCIKESSSPKSVDSETDAWIECALDSAEDLLSHVEAVDIRDSPEQVDDEEDFSNTKKDAEYKTSLGNTVKWLDVLYRSGLAPDHSAECPNNLKRRVGDKAYFR